MRHIGFAGLLTTLWLATATASPAVAQSSRQLAAEAVREILDQPSLQGAVVSARVVLPNGAVVFERNPNLRVMPASNQKLVSCLFALDTLGPDFRFRTRFWREGSRIFVDAPGDPSLTGAQLDDVRQRLGSGPFDAVAVRQAFRPGWGFGWEWDDLGATYAPRITAFTLDRGVFALESDGTGWRTLPDGTGVEVLEDPLLNPGSLRYDAFARTLRVRGPFPALATPRGRFTLPEPDVTAAARLGGPLTTASSLPDRAPDAEIVSAPLIDLVGECLTVSDNLYAEFLLLAAARADQTSEVTYAQATTRAETWLRERVRVPAGAFRVADGSGLSRHNLVTARGLTTLLQWTKRQRWSKALRPGLAAPGRGTLRTRLAGVPFEGKTGTLNLVVALSGYVRRPNGEEWTVSFVVNHALGGSAPARQAVDAAMARLSR